MTEQLNQTELLCIPSFFFLFFLIFCVWFLFLFFLIIIFTLFYFTVLYWFCHTLTWIKIIPKKKKCKKAKWLSEQALQIAEKRREAKGRGEKERYIHLNAEFQRKARRIKKSLPK